MFIFDERFPGSFVMISNWSPCHLILGYLWQYIFCYSFTCELDFSIVSSKLITVSIHFFTSSVTAEKWVPIIEVPVNSLKVFLHRKKREGFSILGLEQTANSIPLDQYIFPKDTVSRCSNPVFIFTLATVSGFGKLQWTILQYTTLVFSIFISLWYLIPPLIWKRKKNRIKI